MEVACFCLPLPRSAAPENVRRVASVLPASPEEQKISVLVALLLPMSMEVSAFSLTYQARTAGWPAVLSSNGSRGTCIPRGLTTFLQGAFTAHLIDLVEQRRDQLLGGHAALLSGEGCHPDQRGGVV